MAGTRPAMTAAELTLGNNRYRYKREQILSVKQK